VSEITPLPLESAKTPTPASVAAKGLGKDDFLKLLVSQLRFQDPLDPVADKEFVGQMAQFSTLEQVANLAQSMTSLSQTSEVSRAVSLIGHTVEYENDDETTTTGKVESVGLVDGNVTLKIGGLDVSPSAVRRVS
jgi:flagellar basal-body rod modification protein FlgD